MHDSMKTLTAISRGKITVLPYGRVSVSGMKACSQACRGVCYALSGCNIQHIYKTNNMCYSRKYCHSFIPAKRSRPHSRNFLYSSTSGVYATGWFRIVPSGAAST